MPYHVIFDIDDTLFPSSEFAAQARRNAVNAMIMMGLKADPDELLSDLGTIIRKKGSNYEHHFDDLCRKRGIRDPSRFVAAAVAAYHDTKTSIQPFPTVPLTLLRLKEAGFRLHIATNGIAVKQWDKLIRLRIALYFDNVFVSGEMGREKDERFFRSVLKTLKAKAGDCVMVGDREDTDILPAKSAGICTIRVMGSKYGKGTEKATKADYSIQDISALPGALRRLKLL